MDPARIAPHRDPHDEWISARPTGRGAFIGGGVEGLLPAGGCRLPLKPAWWAIWIRLPQVSSSTAVVTGPIVGGLLGEAHAEPAQPLVLGPDVVDGEGGERDAVGDQRLLERLDRRVAVGLEQQLGAVRVLRATPRSATGARPSGTSCFFTKPSTSV